MIAGVGMDIIEVSRVATKVARRTGFKETIFSAAEIAFCESKPLADQHFAARFAAKEAFLKATGRGLTLGYLLRDIEVQVDDLGKPHLKLSGNFAKLAAENGWRHFHITLTHTATNAGAVVIIET